MIKIHAKKKSYPLMLDCKNPTKRRKATGGNISTHSGSLWEKKIHAVTNNRREANKFPVMENKDGTTFFEGRGDYWSYHKTFSISLLQMGKTVQ